MKKIIEIRRGDLIPDCARWLKDTQKPEYPNKVSSNVYGNPGAYVCVISPKLVDYDVFEVPEPYPAM